MCLYIDEYSEVLSYTHPRARTEHTCDECRRTITSGETYHRWACIDQGDFVTYKMCDHCRAVVTAGAAIAGCPENWYWGSILNWRDEEFGFVANIIADHDLEPGAKVRMLRFVVLAKRGWREKGGALAPVPAEEAA